MRKAVTAILCLLVCFTTAAFAVGCGKPNAGDTSTVTAIAIGSKPSGAMTVGSTHALTVIVTPSDATGYELEWTSSNPSAVSVSDSGILTAVAEGAAMITVSVENSAGGGTLSDSFAVAAVNPEVVNPATEIQLTGKPDGVVRKGDTFALTATLTAEDPDSECTDTVAWSSSDPSVVSVSLNGAVTALTTGTATIKAAVVGKTDTLFAECEIKVYPAEPADGVYKEDMTGATIGEGKGVLSTGTVSGELLYGGTRYPGVSYSTDDNGKLLVSGTDVRNYDRTFFEPKFDDILGDGNYTVRISATLVESADFEKISDAQWTLYWWSKTSERNTIISEKTGDEYRNTTIAGTTEDGLVKGTFDAVGGELVLTLNTNKPLKGIAFGTSQSTGSNSNYVVRINEISFTPFVGVEDFGITNKSEVSEIRTDESDKKISYDYTNKEGEGAATAFTVKYVSTDEEVLTVDATGKIAPKKAGTATVNVYVDGQAEAKDSVEITVVHVPVETITITRDGEAAGDSIREDVKEKTLPYTINLGYTVTGNPCAYTVAWESNNTDVAEVSADGVVTVKAKGTARITVSVVGQTAKKSVNLVVEDSTQVKVVDAITAKVNGVAAGADDVTIRLGDTVTLTYEVVFADGEKPYSVEWTTDNDSVVDIPEESKNASSVALTINATGTASVKVKVLGETETAEAVVTFVVKKPLVNSISLSGVNATETMNVGETKDFTVVASPADCDDYTIDVTYSVAGVAEVIKTETGYKLVPLKTGNTVVTLSVNGLESVNATIDLTVDKFVVQSEDFVSGAVDEEGVYYGKNFNIGARSSSTTKLAVTKSEEGVVWSAWALGDARLTFHYNGYENLDFTDGKKYVARVTLKTSSAYPNAGYIMIFGYKQTATDAYKNPGASGKDAIATVNGSTARVLVSGKSVNNYFDFTLDGTNSSEFFIAYHSGSNDGKSGATVEVTVADVTVFALGEYNDYDVVEDFEAATTEANINKLSYTGVNFDAVSNSGDVMQIQNMRGVELSSSVSGKGLYYVTSRVFQKGLTETTDNATAVTHPKLIFTYKGEKATSGNYKVRIPMFMTANNTEQVKTTTVEVYYGTASGEKSLVTKSVGWANTLTLIEGEIPAEGWNGQIVIRFFNSAITEQSAGSKMLCYFDGISLKKLA